MNKKNYSIKQISALLSLCLVFSMLTSLAPASSFNFSEQETVSGDSSGTDFVLEEDTTLRDAFTKHYIDPNGKRYAVIFPEQIHFKDGESWVEIDNTLQYDALEDAFVSQNDLFVSSFAKTANENRLITIRDGNYQLSWSVDFDSDIIDQGDQPDFAATNSTIKSVNAQITSAEQNDSSTMKSRETISNIGKAVSGVTYKGICDNVDLRYTVLHGKLEEDIILNSPDAISSYTLKINTDGLIAVKRTDNSISFEDEDGNTVFSLAAPWMKDSDVSVTDAINVEISQAGNSVSVKYTPDSEWLSDESRVFPVLIDPSFSTRYYTSNYYDTYVYEGDSASSTRPTETTMKVGKISNKNYYSYIKLLNFPDLVGGFSVDEASFDFWVNTTSSLALNLYKVNASWNQNSITYANQPASTLIKNSVTGTANGSNSKYSMDITSWFDDLQDEWTNVSDFFKSSSWNGFKIAYTNSVNGNYTQIYSSEYNTVEFRPVLTIQYTYWPNGGIEDGAVYSFVNKSSGKYLTVDGGNTSNGTNVYQYSKNNSLSQAFRLYYEEDDNCFRIRAMCSSNGYGSVLEVPSFSGTIDNTTGYTNSNVRLYSYGSLYPNDQEWIIYPYEYSDYYMVVLRADPNLALTSFGSGNGTSGGTSSTSTGNVFVSQFTGADNQLWKLESGGIQVIDGYNIKEEDGGSYNISENQSWLSFCCPTTEFGDSVSWHSSNTTSATVDSLGHVVTGTAGIAYIEATITHSDESEDYYSYTLYVIIPDGTYYFNDKTSNQRRLEYESQSNGLLENAILESYGTNATSEPTQRYRIFKVKYLGAGLYSVRSMLDCAMGWTRSGSSMVMTTIGTSNSTVPSTAKWRIKSDTNGYFIHAYNGTSQTVTAGSSSGDDITLGSYSSSNLREHWTIRKITAQYHGVTLKAKTDELEVGDSFAFTAAVYSTYTDVYGQNGVTWSRTNGTGTATINSSTGLLTGTSKGTVTITATYIVNSYTQLSENYQVTITGLLIYRTRNRERLGFANPDDITDITPITAEDLQYGQKSAYVLTTNGTMISLSDLYTNLYDQIPIPLSTRISTVKNFFNSQIEYDQTFSTILSQMIDHLVDGSGTDYTNSDLTNAVKNHQRTQDYVNSFISVLDDCIVTAGGSITSLYYDEDLWTQPVQRNNHPLVYAMQQEMQNNSNLELPSYGYNNGVPGLSLAINGWYGNKIEIESFEKSGNNYYGTLRFTFYDHFGLDTQDMTETHPFNIVCGYFPGFRQWYIIQHWDGLGSQVQPQPFVTLVSYTVVVTGSLS